MALFTEWHNIWPHLLVTLYELIVGFAIGGSIGFVMAAVITQFPFVEKVVTPYILLLVTTPMLALVPLLILRFGFGSEPRIIAVALAAGPMVMINSATGFRRVDLAEDRARPLFRRKHAADLHQDPHPHGDADDHRRADGRLDLRLADDDRRGNGGRRRGTGQPADLLFVADPHAAVLRDHPHPRDHRHLDLRVLLLVRKEVGQLGGVSACDPAKIGQSRASVGSFATRNVNDRTD